MPVVRTHFSSSSVRGFPEYLLHNLYDVDSDGSLKPATRHVRGQALVDIVEVQRWSSSAARISQIFGAAGIAVNGIDVSGFRDADGSVLTNLIASLRNSLVKIEMSRCFANQPTIISALSSVEHLTSLNVADNPLLIDDDAIFLLMRNLNQLTVLDISGCTFLSDKSLMSIANSCGCQLKSLSSRRNHLITDSAANQVLMKCECLEFLDFSCCPKLKMLRVLTCCGGNVPMFVSRSLNCVILDNCPNLSAESFDWLCASNANLTRLSIMDAKSMLESSLLGLIFSCCNLVQLNLKGCSGVTGKVLRTIADKCRRLSDLSIARLGLDTSSFDVRNLLLGTGSSCLDRLDISGNVNLGDDVFALSVHNAAKDRLNLTWLNVAKCCLSGQGVSTLAERCPSLRHLDISDVKGVTDAAVRTIVESCKQLRELWMDDCPSVTNRAVIAIAYGLPKLFSLHLSSSSDLTQDSFGDTIRHYQYSDDAVEALLDGSRSLQDLSLRNQNGVCFASPWFAKSFPKRAGHFRLQKLDLFGVDNLNVRGAMAVFRHCSDLSEVILSRRLPSTFRTRKFWESCFSKAAYTMNYEDTKHLAKATAAQSRLRVAESELCHVERDADVVLKRAQTRESKLPTDSPVRSMSFSGANQVSPTGAEVMQQKQRDADRISRFSMDNVDGGERALTPPSSPLKGKRRRSVQEEVLAIEDHKSKRANAPHLLLRPHAQAAALRYRDMYVRMRLLENYSASIIKRKWKCHALWSKIRLKVCARRIAKWYKGLLDTRRRKKLKNHLHYVGRAKSIQRVFRVYLSLLWHAAISIQRISRGGRARTNLKNQTKRRIASTRIQSWTRGWLARLSDRCALSRLYLLLPPFWRLILHSVPFAQTDNTVSSIVPMRGSGESAISNSADATFERNRNHTHAVNNIRTAHIGDEEVSMADIIGMRQTVDLMTSKKNSLLPSDSELQRRGGGRARLPFRIPQSFDEASYYSLDDGRHIPITGVQKAIAMADGSPGHHPGNGTNAQPPMHLYGLKLWPVDGTTHAYDRKSLLVFNPHNDNMKTGLAGAREALLCLTCNRHLSLLYCETCMKGFCFTCMFRVHALNSKRGHQVTLLEPRVTLQASEENTDTCRSLTYHMVLANEASHLIRDLIKNLGSTIDLEKKKKEKRMAKEYQEEEEARRRVFLQAAEEDQDKHLAASRIASLYQKMTAVKAVQELRLQAQVALADKAVQRFNAFSGVVQRMVRQHCTRGWFALWGIRFDPNRVGPMEPRGRKTPGGPQEVKISREDVVVRVGFEQQQRRLLQRLDTLFEIKKQYAELNALLSTNISHWKNRVACIGPEERKLLQFVVQRKAMHQDKIKQMTHPDHLRRLLLAVAATEQRVANLREIRALINLHLMSCYRRQAGLEARYTDLEARLEWVGTESAILARAQFQIARRLEIFAHKPGTKQVVEWLSRTSELAALLQASFDSQQESLLQEEITELQRDDSCTRQSDSLMQELAMAFEWDANMIAEKVALEMRVLALSQEAAHTDEAIRVGQQLLSVRKKISLLSVNMIDPLKIEFQQRLQLEAARAQGVYFFPEGSLDFKIAEMPQTVAQMVEPFVPPRHLRLNDLFNTYFAQPWLAEMAVTDVRLEEELLVLSLDERKLEADLSSLRTIISDGRESLKNYDMKEEDLNIEIEERELLNKEPINDYEFEHEENKLRIFHAMKAELKMVITERSFAVQMQERTESLEPPIVERLQALQSRQEALSSTLEASRAERESMVAGFLDNESIFASTTTLMVKQTLEEVRVSQYQLEQCRSKCESVLPNPHLIADVLMKIEQDSLPVADSDLLGLSLLTEKERMAGRWCLSQLLPRLISVPSVLLKMQITCRERALAVDLRVLEKLLETIEDELEAIEDFENKREEYAESTRLLRAELLKLRRQRATQRELDERNGRLKELRDKRQREKLELLLRLAEEERLRKLEAEKHPPRPKPNYVNKAGSVLRKNIRATKDMMRSLRDGKPNVMDAEEQRMAEAMCSRSTAALEGRPEGIRRLHLTCTAKEGARFQQQCDMLKLKGLPHFNRMSNPLGGQVYLWIETTFDSGSFITSVKLSHQTVGHDLNRSDDLSKDGYYPVLSKGVALELWIKCSKLSSKGLAELAISTTEKEEEKLVMFGFEQCRPPDVLAEYGVPGATSYLWMRYIEKGRASNIGPTATATNMLLTEAMRVRLALKDKPNDDLLLKASVQLAADLSKKREREKALRAEKDISSDPLQMATEMMALSEAEIQRWQVVFAGLDKAKTGYITLPTLFVAIDEPDTDFARDIFTSVDALDRDNGEILEFPDFMKAISIYCMFGPMEIIKTCFNFADKDRIGNITPKQLTDTLLMIHCGKKTIVHHILLQLALPSDERINLDAFFEIYHNHPTLLYPIFRLQHRLRDYVMGTDWWITKLRKYEDVRMKLTSSTSLSDQRADIEVARWEADEARKLRIAKRAQAIKREGSMVKLALLRAKQLADELS